MTTRLNSYILTDDLKDVMRNKLDKSREEKREKGFTLCSKSDNIIVEGDHTTGTPDGITIDSSMYKKEKNINIMRKDYGG